MPDPKPNGHSLGDCKVMRPMAMESLAAKTVSVFIIVSGLVGFCGVWVAYKTAPDYVWSSCRWVLNTQNYGPMIDTGNGNLKRGLGVKPYISPLFWLYGLFVGSRVGLVQDARHRADRLVADS